MIPLPNDELDEDEVRAQLDGWMDELAGGNRLLRLEYPLEIMIGAGGKKAEPMEFDTLEFRRPKAAILDIATGKGAQMAIVREMISSMLVPVLDGVKIMPRHLENLDLIDFTRASLTMGLFFPRPPKAAALETGET
ncbi:hypothetical protein [Magnetospirillum fulvum]|uniref:Uncharacterized protein n=1 Tax=Magnetospirillum fulvum MGU-K5 TaxID=1316936 RepID=S9TS48_MAGFU|nr:hypothetical protein [Magnetospirillum fulvum]EPY01380.1 hypothetical protein K678_11301 [Magnetospirillum fulvum MGU-K5]